MLSLTNQIGRNSYRFAIPFEFCLMFFGLETTNYAYSMSMNRLHHVHFHHQASTHPIVASKNYPPDVVRREVKNLAFDTLPLEEVVKAFKDNKDSRGQRVPEQFAGRYFFHFMNFNDLKSLFLTRCYVKICVKNWVIIGKL